MRIFMDALPADNTASGGEGAETGTAAPQKTVGFKEAVKDFITKNPIPENQEESGTESDQEEVGPEKEVGKEDNKEVKKEPEFDPLKDDESDSADGDEITEIGVLNEKGEFEKKKFVDVLDQAVFTLKVDKKLYTVNGYEKLKNLAQQGLNSTKINTEAKRVFAENQQMKAGFEQAVQARAIEIANSMLLDQTGQELGDPTADAGGANAKMFALLKKQNEDLKAQMNQRFQQEDQARQQALQQQAQQHWAQEAQKIGDATIEPFKPYFKDATGKPDEMAFSRFQRDVKIETRERLEQLQAEGHEPVFSPEEVGQEMLKMARKVYRDLDSFAERRAQAKVALKKKGSGAAALTPGGTSVESTKFKPGEKVTFAKIKAGKFTS